MLEPNSLYSSKKPYMKKSFDFFFCIFIIDFLSVSEVLYERSYSTKVIANKKELIQNQYNH